MKKIIVILVATLMLAACNVKQENEVVNTDDFEGTYIYISDNGSLTNAEGVSISDSLVKISSGGTFNIYGSADDLQLLIDSSTQVTLKLNGITLANEDGPAILVEEAEEVTLHLVEKTTNTISDSNSDYNDPETSSVIYSKDDLVFTGDGTLNVTANYNDAIRSNDDLTIEGGTFNIVSVGDAFFGNDSITIEDGVFNITTYTGAESREIETAVIENDRPKRPGQKTETVETEDDGSQKAFKTDGTLIINNGEFLIDSYDDAFHADSNITIENGSFNISSGDDAVRAGNLLEINGGTFDINYAYEGLEGFIVTINDGAFDIDVFDDGINAATESDTEANVKQAGGMPPEPSYEEIDYENDPHIIINGGTLNIVADGDGIDANGGVFINGGKVYVSGSDREFPPDSAIDFDITAEIDGGTALALGGTMMSHPYSEQSTQLSVHYQLDSSVAKNSVVKILDQDGNLLSEMTAINEFQVVSFSSPELEKGDEITIDINGNQFKITLNDDKMVTTNLY